MFTYVGDDPPRDRTSELRILGFPTRHLGPVQMTTDTALGVTKLIVDDHLSLNEIPYIVSVLLLVYIVGHNLRQISRITPLSNLILKNL